MRVEQAGSTVTLTPVVLVRIAERAVRAIPGVARLGGPGVTTGVVLRERSNGMRADCFLTALPDVSLTELGIAVQFAVRTALHTLAGVAVAEVNVYIQDVDGTIA